MDFSSLLIAMAGLTYIGAVVYVANLVEVKRGAAQNAEGLSPFADSYQDTILRWLQYGLIGLTFLIGLMVMQLALFSGLATQLAEETVPQITVNTAWAVVTFIVAVIASVLGLSVVTSEKTRERLRRLIGAYGVYDPQSNVHTTAVVLVLLITVYAFFSLVSPPGADIQVDGGDLVFQAVLQVVITLLGVGMAIRRTVPQTVERLGLRIPTRADVAWGVGLGFVFIVLSSTGTVIWQQLTSPELFEEQTALAESLTQSFTTIPLAFLLAISAAVGEEIWVRGGLQPVFGLLATSLFFTALHTQYTLTPATLIIFIISLGLGWLRQRHSTTAAMIAHFVFNFVPLALAISISVQP